MGQIHNIPLKKLKPSPLNPRTELGNIDGFARNLKAQGQIETLIVRRWNNESSADMFEVLRGLRTYEAAKKARLDTLRAEVKKLNDAQALMLIISSDLHHKNYTELEEAKVFKNLLENYPELFPNQRAIENHFGTSQQHISKLMALLDFPESVQKKIGTAEEVREGKKDIGVKKASLIRQRIDVEDQKQVEDWIEKSKEMTEKQLEEALPKPHHRDIPEDRPRYLSIGLDNLKRLLLDSSFEVGKDEKYSVGNVLLFSIPHIEFEVRGIEPVNGTKKLILERR